MVRLRELRGFEAVIVIYKFQFQYGAIKRETVIGVIAILNKFQFQYGAIKRSIPLARTCSNTVISIPIWCD